MNNDIKEEQDKEHTITKILNELFRKQKILEDKLKLLSIKLDIKNA